MKISVIIPVLNESLYIKKTLQAVESGNDTEIILVDGGCHDDTLSLAAPFSPGIIRSKKGRGIQMNSGALHATGEILLFLHADTLLPGGYDREIRQILKPVPNVLGAFRFGVDDTSLRFRLLSIGINLRSILLKRPYGDQAFFMRKDFFHRVGGFPDIPILEDIVLLRRIKKRGFPVRISTLRVVTSARRWKKLGLVQNTIQNQCALWLYWLGLSPEIISRHCHRS